MNYFAYPEMFSWLAVPAALLLLGWWARRGRAQALERFGRWAAVGRLLPAGLARRRRWIFGLRWAGLVALVLALAGPLIGSRLVEFKQRGLDVFIAVDCSLSMQAQDLMPNRMAHAKLLLGQLIDRLAGSRIGIVAFAGQAYVQCPLTIDAYAARDALEAVDVGSVPIPGTVIGQAIRTALKGLQAGEGGHRVLVLLTDGEDHDSDPLGAAKEAARLGMKIYAIGIGSLEGQPIPLFDESGNRIGYKQDRQGEVVLSRLDEKTLTEVARLSGGQYFPPDPTGVEVEPLVRALNELEQGDVRQQLFNRFENRFQWPLALGLLLWLAGLMIPEKGRER